MGCLLFAGCLVSEGHFEDYDAVKGSDASAWGGVMERLPLDATDIYTRSNKDSGELQVRFRFGVTDGMQEGCHRVEAEGVVPPRRRKVYKRVRWWKLRDLEEPVEYWSCPEEVPYQDGRVVRHDSYFALSKESGTGYYWSNGHWGSHEVQSGSPDSAD